jgi:LPXTG-motif cell wall-anchored protein
LPSTATATTSLALFGTMLGLAGLALLRQSRRRK